MKRYGRPYRVRKKKSILRKRFFWVFFLFFLALGSLAYLFFFSSVFQIKAVRISGTGGVSQEEIRDFFPGGNIFLLSATLLCYLGHSLSRVACFVDVSLSVNSTILHKLYYQILELFFKLFSKRLCCCVLQQLGNYNATPWRRLHGACKNIKLIIPIIMSKSFHKAELSH